VPILPIHFVVGHLPEVGRGRGRRAFPGARALRFWIPFRIL